MADKISDGFVCGVSKTNVYSCGISMNLIRAAFYDDISFVYESVSLRQILRLIENAPDYYRLTLKSINPYLRYIRDTKTERKKNLIS